MKKTKNLIKKGTCVIDVDLEDTNKGMRMTLKAKGNCKKVLGKDVENTVLNLNLDD